MIEFRPSFYPLLRELIVSLFLTYSTNSRQQMCHGHMCSLKLLRYHISIFCDKT